MCDGIGRLGVPEVEAVVGVGGMEGLLEVGSEVVESEWAISCHGDGRRTGSSEGTSEGIEFVDAFRAFKAEAWVAAECDSCSSARCSKEVVEVDGLLLPEMECSWCPFVLEPLVPEPMSEGPAYRV